MHHIFPRKKVCLGVDVADGFVPEVGVEAEKAARLRIPLNLKRFSDVMRHLVTKVNKS